MTHLESVLIVAGEASADAHGARVIAAIKRARPDVQVFGVGGAAMRAEGLEAVARAEEISVAGLTEVLFAIPRIFGILRRLVREAVTRRPKVAILIDLPDFNLRLARRLRRRGIPVVYYISPQIWAWRRGRVRQIREIVSEMLVVLPFEQSFYEEHDVPARFVGHPLVEALPAEPDVRAARADLGLEPASGPVVALLPGSRRKEVSRHLPRMIEAVRLLQSRFPNTRAVIPVASTIPLALVQKLTAGLHNAATIVDGRATEALIAADAAVVCSGTATLQAALLAKPMVVVYRVSWLSFQILKRLVKVSYIALVNLIANRQLVAELVQNDFTPTRLVSELSSLLGNPPARDQLLTDYAAIRQQLGGPGASERVADVVLGYLAGDAVESSPDSQTACKERCVDP